MISPCGIVLAGGKSSRLGRDKAAVRFEGCDLLVRTVRAVQAVCSEVWVIGRNPAAHGLDLPWKVDEQPAKGPIGGIITGLRALGGPCLVLTCDLPFLSRPLLDRLIDCWQRKPSKALMTTFLHEATGFVEPLVAIYEFSALPVLEAGLLRGEHRLSGIISAGYRHHLVCRPEEERAFFNVNHPADLVLLKELEARSFDRCTAEARP